MSLRFYIAVAVGIAGLCVAFSAVSPPINIFTLGIFVGFCTILALILGALDH